MDTKDKLYINGNLSGYKGKGQKAPSDNSMIGWDEGSGMAGWLVTYEPFIEFIGLALPLAHTQLPFIKPFTFRLLL